MDEIVERYHRRMDERIMELVVTYGLEGLTWHAGPGATVSIEIIGGYGGDMFVYTMTEHEFAGLAPLLRDWQVEFETTRRRKRPDRDDPPRCPHEKIDALRNAIGEVFPHCSCVAWVRTRYDRAWRLAYYNENERRWYHVRLGLTQYDEAERPLEITTPVEWRPVVPPESE